MVFSDRVIPVSYTHLDVYKRQVHEESDIAEFDSLMREVEQMKRQIENLISNMVEKMCIRDRL